jgi:hypothetical protein
MIIWSRCNPGAELVYAPSVAVCACLAARTKTRRVRTSSCAKCHIDVLDVMYALHVRRSVVTCAVCAHLGTLQSGKNKLLTPQKLLSVALSLLFTLAR